MANDLLVLLARSIRQAVIDGYAAAGVPLPPRQMIVNGEVALDCPLLAVELERVYAGLPGVEDIQPQCVVTRSAQFKITLTRCAPGIETVTVGEMEASATEILTDAKVLVESVTNAYHNKTLLTDGCDVAAIGNLASLGPEGGEVGWTLTLVVQF